MTSSLALLYEIIIAPEDSTNIQKHKWYIAKKRNVLFSNNVDSVLLFLFTYVQVSGVQNMCCCYLGPKCALVRL
jgi:hypothetical protein